MMTGMKTIRLFSAVLAIAMVGLLQVRADDTPQIDDGETIGPANGSLVIVGGGITEEILNRFVELAGGDEARFVVIPTAIGGENTERFGRGFANRLEAMGAQATVLHTADPEEADRDDFVAPLRQATGVWFTGGRQWRLVDAYAGTKTETELRAVLERGGVIGGSSAGATIQGSFLVRGDTRGNALMMGDHQVGFGYLKNSAIDQHVLARNRQFDMVEVIEAHPQLLGIGLDENTAIVVQGNEFQVVGDSYVAIYDHERMSDDEQFFFLGPGDRFDLQARRRIGGRRR